MEDCKHEGSPTFQVMRAVDGEAKQVTACSQCQTPADLPNDVYDEAKEALPEGYGADLVQQVEAAQMEQSLGVEDD